MILAMPIEAFSEVDLDRLEQSKIPEKPKKLDHLVPGRWQTALDLRRRPQMSQEIRSSAGPFLGAGRGRRGFRSLRLTTRYTGEARTSSGWFSLAANQVPSLRGWSSDAKSSGGRPYGKLFGKNLPELWWCH